MINEVIEAVAQITTSETFLITVAFLALVLGVVIIVVVIVTRNSSKQKKLPRIVR
jgi:hypothetical protein